MITHQPEVFASVEAVIGKAKIDLRRQAIISL
jgi:hypothetical protein